MASSMRVYTCLILAALLALASGNNYYELLEIGRDAKDADIKRAFRKLSLKYHPDKNLGDEEASNKFKQINRAYEILSDPDKRQVYDQQGQEGLERLERGGDNRQKGPTARADVHVTLEEMYLGTSRDMSIARNVYCPKCRGTGAKDGKTKQCPKCNGQGVIMQKVQVAFGMQMQMQTACDRCGGRGQVTAQNCPHCQGRKVVNDVKTLTVQVEKGMKDGDEVVFEREAEQIPDMIPGDLVFTVKQKPHNRFKRVNDNLFVDVNVSLEEALLGFSKRVQHLDGHLVEVSSGQDEVVQPFAWKVIKGEGMPKRNVYSEFGDLHSKINIQFPKTLTERQRQLIDQILTE